METAVDLNAVYAPAEDDVVARELHGEFIIIPISSGVGDLEDEIFSLNETGKAVWDKLDGKKNLKEVTDELASDFEGSPDEIRDDVIGIMEELLKRKIILEC
ncbi:MAG: PqqD family protein [Victivallaceae bacterium]|nr:PqqD family protein [Victivallaceae bacterium]